MAQEIPLLESIVIKEYEALSKAYPILTKKQELLAEKQQLEKAIEKQSQLFEADIITLAELKEQGQDLRDAVPKPCKGFHPLTHLKIALCAVLVKDKRLNIRRVPYKFVFHRISKYNLLSYNKTYIVIILFFGGGF